MCKLPPCLKIITVSLYTVLLFLTKTVILFLLVVFVNELNKAGVFETVAEAEPWHAQLQDPGPVWGSTGIGSHLVSYILPLMKCRWPKLKHVVSQCKRVQHVNTDFWPRPFSEDLTGRKGKVTRDGWCLHPFTKSSIWGQQAMTVSAVCQTHFFTCCWTEWRSWPRLGDTLWKGEFFNLDYLAKLWKKWWTVSADPKGQEQWLARDLMSSLWWATWKKVTSEIIDNDMSVCCAIYPAASTFKGLLYSHHHLHASVGLLNLSLSSQGQELFGSGAAQNTMRCAQSSTCCTAYFPCMLKQEHVQAEPLCPLEVLYLTREQQCPRGRIIPAY